jgi:hypothetical protein
VLTTTVRSLGAMTPRSRSLVSAASATPAWCGGCVSYAGVVLSAARMWGGWTVGGSQ